MQFDVQFAGEVKARYLGMKKRFRSDDDSLSPQEAELLRKLHKVKKLLEEQGPDYNSLNTHPIDELTREYGETVWESYVDQGEHAFRIFWAYGPGRKDITIIGLEPHPESKNRKAYSRISLAEMPEE